MKISPNTAASILSPMTLVPIGAVLASMVGLFGVARHVTTVEVKTQSNTDGLAEVREAQKSTAKEIDKDLTQLKTMQASTDAKVSMLIDHFGIESKRNRR